MLTRRDFLSLLALLAAPAATLVPQGMSGRNVKPAPRGKPSGIPFLAQFTDIAKQAGLTLPVIYGEEDKREYILETMGCGVAFFDFDNDGWLDILVLSGIRLENTPPQTSNRLYKNNRDGTFKDVTVQAGLFKSGWASSVTVGDFNNDGFEDLFITYYGENVLYRNNGDGTFTDVTKQAGLVQSGRLWGSGCTFIDYDRDGYLDLFIANYLDLDLKTVPKPGARWSTRCPSAQLEGCPCQLRAARVEVRSQLSISQQRRWNVYGCEREVRHLQG